MTPAPFPANARFATRHARLLLPLLLLPVAVYSQDGADPAGLGYESATESHRGFDAGLPPSETEADDMRMGLNAPTIAPDMGAASAESEMDTNPAGVRPAPLDPDAVEPMTRSGERAVADTPSQGQGDVESSGTSVPEDNEPAGTSDRSSWAAANDSVGKIGGWRTYARELYESDDEVEGAMPAPVEPDSAGETVGQDMPAMVDAPPRKRATLSHESVLEDYARYEEADGPGWIEANDVVGQIGGWRTYARELYESNDDEGNAK